jgi:hypothetical protein
MTHADQTFLSLTRFVYSNIYITVYYKNIFNDLSNVTNYAPLVLIFLYIYLVKVKNVDFLQARMTLFTAREEYLSIYLSIYGYCKRGK